MKRKLILNLAVLGLISAFANCSNNGKIKDVKPETTYDTINRHPEQRVAVFFRKSPDAIDSLPVLETHLKSALEKSKTGIYRNNYEEMPGIITLHMFGPNAEKLFNSVKPVLKQYSFMEESEIEFRLGTPGPNTKYVKFYLNTRPDR